MLCAAALAKNARLADAAAAAAERQERVLISAYFPRKWVHSARPDEYL